MKFQLYEFVDSGNLLFDIVKSFWIVDLDKADQNNEAFHLIEEVEAMWP